MFCRWFNHQNLYSKFLTVFCPDSRVLSKKLGRWVGYWMLWWRYFPHEKRSCYASAKLQPFQESSKFVILTNGRGWQWFLTGCLNSYQSSGYDHADFQFNPSPIQPQASRYFISLQAPPFFFFSPIHSWYELLLLPVQSATPGQYYTVELQLCWLDLRPVLDLASSVSSHYYLGETLHYSVHGRTVICVNLWNIQWKYKNNQVERVDNLTFEVGHHAITVVGGGATTTLLRPLYFYNKTK